MLGNPMRQSHKGLKEGIPQATFLWSDTDTKESKEVEPWEMGKTKRMSGTAGSEVILLLRDLGHSNLSQRSLGGKKLGRSF